MKSWSFRADNERIMTLLSDAVTTDAEPQTRCPGVRLLCEPALLLRRTGKLTWAFSTCNNLKYYLEPHCHSGYVVWNVSFPLSAASSSITIISNSRRMRRLKWRATGETHFDPFISNLQWGQLAVRLTVQTPGDSSDIYLDLCGHGGSHQETDPEASVQVGGPERRLLALTYT